MITCGVIIMAALTHSTIGHCHLRHSAVASWRHPSPFIEASYCKKSKTVDWNSTEDLATTTMTLNPVA